MCRNFVSPTTRTANPFIFIGNKPALMFVVKFLFALVIALICGVVLSLAGAYLYLSPNLPSVESLRHVELQMPLRVYSQDELLIEEFGEMRRTPIRFDEVPPDFINALLSAEDDNFTKHHGVDPGSLLRAAAQLIKTGRIQTGGSTITMQVAKNFFLTSERSFSRKANEILRSLVRKKFLATCIDRKSTRLNSSHVRTSYAVFCLKKKKTGPAGGQPRRLRPPFRPVLLDAPRPLRRLVRASPGAPQTLDDPGMASDLRPRVR